MYKIIFTDSYQKKAKKYFQKHLDLKNQYEKCLILLESNPFHPSLRFHQLKGKLSSIHSVSINPAYRLTINFLIKDNIINPIDIGTHDDIYK